jgi:hypothetical protein
MPVHKVTSQERKDWLGSGIVQSGIKLPKRLPQPSNDRKPEANPPDGDQAWSENQSYPCG